MECVILVRLTSGKVVGIGDEGVLSTFRNRDEAVAFADNSPVCQSWRYQIVELDKLWVDGSPTLGYSAWLRKLAASGGKGTVDNIDARALGRIADRLDALDGGGNDT